MVFQFYLKSFSSFIFLKYMAGMYIVVCACANLLMYC